VIARVGIPFSRDPRVSPEIAAFIRGVASLAGKPSSQERVTVMKVWIDQDLCTGDGLCEEIAPDVFTLLDDGLAYVKEGDKVFSDPGGAEGLANVPAGQEEATIEAAEECPGECIFIEVD
jgi:ferredoxin